MKTKTEVTLTFDCQAAIAEQQRIERDMGLKPGTLAAWRPQLLEAPQLAAVEQEEGRPR